MNRRNVLNLSAIIVLALGLLPGSAISQQKSLKEEILGSWLFVSIYDQYGDGKKVNNFGTNVKGTITFGGDGRFSQIIIGEPHSEMKSADPRRPDGFVILYYGTYTVNEADKTVEYKIEVAGNSMRNGSQVRNTVTVNGDTLSYVGSPRKDQHGTFTPHGELKRAK